MSNDHGTWYVVQTQVNAETKAARNLVQQGFEVYLPRYLKRRSHARRIEKIAAPLFPRYLFVRIDMSTQRWRSIQSTFGVSRLVLSGADPAPVSQAVLASLRQREDESGYVRLNQKPKFALGDKVRILEGVFTENLGLFDGLADRDRVAILLSLLGRKVRVSIDADLVAAA
ncbi:transcription termination/antitermination protein NusG [Bradyrhizobium sp. AUGA SZCCT0042]|uniref:transcription termination/antitermination protein NusG n=1 Tax=Bradyrhizobium sp. AUGA SZCCT0042 TaxID=2807651 RepID=UPI001BA5B795|nr:transcriptional activator RfaH [Bradyrhizobium sp. AUGA SZCCT0042]MBR1301746.1 transcriptional activator RfaH [Bradyrhizobium sp. AUGA SZCCT0042]